MPRVRRLDLGLLQREAAQTMGVSKATVWLWEASRVEPEVFMYPAIIAFLGYDPFPEPKSRGEAIWKARVMRGWTKKELARQARVDEQTVKHLKADNPLAYEGPRRRVEGVLGLG